MTNAVAVRDVALALPNLDGVQYDPPPQAERRVAFWMNGEKDKKRLGGTDYTGGWAMNAENLNPSILDGKQWELEVKIARGTNKEFQVFTTPVIHVAMLGWREAWVQRELPEGVRPTYQQHYGEGLTSYVELAVIADSVKTPLMLTAKGMNANRLKKAYSAAVNDLARYFKKSVPPFAFFMALGGELDEKGEPVFTQYGKGKKVSSIVHITPRWNLNKDKPEGVTPVSPELLEVAQQFVAADLKAWKVARFQQVETAPVVGEDEAHDSESDGFQ